MIINLPKKIDYKKLNDYLDYLGKLGEKIIYNHERELLKDTKYYEKVSLEPSHNHLYGYDINSFEKNGTPVMIEVKTTTGNVEDAFYVTDRELKTAREAWSQGKKYKFYRVGNVGENDISKVTIKIYEDLSEDKFEFEEVLHKVKEK